MSNVEGVSPRGQQEDLDRVVGSHYVRTQMFHCSLSVTKHLSWIGNHAEAAVIKFVRNLNIRGKLKICWKTKKHVRQCHIANDTNVFCRMALKFQVTVIKVLDTGSNLLPVYRSCANV